MVLIFAKPKRSSIIKLLTLRRRLFTQLLFRMIFISPEVCWNLYGNLLIIYPVAMAWSARYVHKLPGKYKMYGGKPLLLTLLFGIFVVFIDIMLRSGFLPTPQK